MARPVYFDTSMFLEMGAKKSKYKKSIRTLLRELQDEKISVYTSIITVEEVSVAVYQAGTMAKDTYGDIRGIARVYGVTKDIALTAAKNEAKLKDITLREQSRRDPKKPETEPEKLERICENRRRKWDCFHLATAQSLNCQHLYSTDENLQKRPRQLELKNIVVIPPDTPVASIKGPLVAGVETEKV